MKKIALFASGAGSNAAVIIEKFKNHPNIKVSLVVSNKPNAGVLSIALQHEIPVLILDKEIFFRGNAYADQLKAIGINYIILAGFLWKIPVALIKSYNGKIINIHPALLPKYGGKGMYGLNVHQAVINNNESESGISIHYVDEHYDNGDIILQAKCPVLKNDTAISLAARIQQLEHEYYPNVIEELLGK